MNSAAFVLALLLGSCGSGRTADAVDRLAGEVTKESEALSALTVRVAGLETEIHKLASLGACVPAHEDTAPSSVIKPAPFYIASDPTGASVSVDGVHVGETPMTITVAKPRFHLTLDKPGFISVAREVDRALEGASVAITLTKQ